MVFQQHYFKNTFQKKRFKTISLYTFQKSVKKILFSQPRRQQRLPLSFLRLQLLPSSNPTQAFYNNKNESLFLNLSYRIYVTFARLFGWFWFPFCWIMHLLEFANWSDFPNWSFNIHAFTSESCQISAAHTLNNKGIGDAGSTADFRMLWSAMVCLGLL